MADVGQSVAVVVLTGCLGSGKTTLLRRLLQSADARVAVLVNEFGEVGIDHEILGAVAPDVVLLESGCLCCTVRGELRDSVLDLLRRRDRGELPPFDRIVLETSGLAEPAPILSTLACDRSLRGRVHVAGVVTVVDCLNAAHQMEAAPEWALQVAAADMVCLTKLDLAGETEVREAFAAVRRMSPIATIADAAEVAPSDILDLAAAPRGFRGLALAADDASRQHVADVQSFVLVVDEMLDWERFALWLSLLLHRHGDRILRVKALLDLGLGGPIVLDGVQHVVHVPVHQPAWRNADHRSRIVFITRGLRPEDIRRSFDIVVRPQLVRSSAA